MLKIIKYDYKQLLLLPLLLATLLFLVNSILIILTISLPLTKESLNLILNINYYSCYFVITASLIYTGSFLLVKELTNYKLYILTDVPVSRIVLTRYIVYFLTIMLIALLCNIQTTVLHSFANSYHPSLFNTINTHLLLFSLLGQPFLSWLFCMDVAFFAAIIYSIILILATLNKYIWNIPVKIIAIIFTAVGLGIILLMNTHSSNRFFFWVNLNYNDYSYLSTYLPSFTNNDKNFLFSSYIFNVNTIILGVVFIITANLIYLLTKTTTFFKQKIAKICYIGLILILSAVFLAYPIAKEAVIAYESGIGDEQIHIGNGVHEIITMDKGQKINLKSMFEETFSFSSNDYGTLGKENFSKSNKLYRLAVNGSYLNDIIFLDNDLNIYSKETGVYKCSLIMSFYYKTKTYYTDNILTFILIVNETDYSDYIHVHDISQIDNNNGKYILMDNITINATESHLKYGISDFNGKIINPYGYIISLDNACFVVNLGSAGLLDGLIVNFDISHNLYNSAVLVKTNKGIIKDCIVTGKAFGRYVGGITQENSGIIYGNIFSGEITATLGGGLTLDNTKEGIIQNNNYNIKFVYRSKIYNVHPICKDSGNSKHIKNNNGYVEYTPSEE